MFIFLKLHKDALLSNKIPAKTNKNLKFVVVVLQNLKKLNISDSEKTLKKNNFLTCLLPR